VSVYDLSTSCLTVRDPEPTFAHWGAFSGCASNSRHSAYRVAPPLQRVRALGLSVSRATGGHSAIVEFPERSKAEAFLSGPSIQDLFKVQRSNDKQAHAS